MTDNIIRVGIVTVVNPYSAKVRVTFDDLTSDDSTSLLSGWLPVVQRGSTRTQSYWLPDVGSEVVCLMLPNGASEGFVVGTMYNADNLPPYDEAGARYVQFEDSTLIKYSLNGGIEITSPQMVRITAPQVIING